MKVYCFLFTCSQLQNNLQGNQGSTQDKLQKGYNKKKLPIETENTPNRKHPKKHKNKLLDIEFNGEETTDDFTISEEITEVEGESKVDRRRNDKRKKTIKYDKTKSIESDNDSEILQENGNFSYFEVKRHVPKRRLKLDGKQVILQNNSDNIFSAKHLFYSMLFFEFVVRSKTILDGLTTALHAS